MCLAHVNTSAFIFLKAADLGHQSFWVLMFWFHLVSSWLPFGSFWFPFKNFNQFALAQCTRTLAKNMTGSTPYNSVCPVGFNTKHLLQSRLRFSLFLSFIWETWCLRSTCAAVYLSFTSETWRLSSTVHVSLRAWYVPGRLSDWTLLAYCHGRRASIGLVISFAICLGKFICN